MVYASACALVALAAALVVGGPAVRFLRARGLGKAESGEEPAEWAARAGKPTMGGIIFLVPIMAVGGFIAFDRDADLWFPLLAMIAAAAWGLVDDAQTLVGRQRLSGHERWFWAVKWSVILGMGAVVAVVLYGPLGLTEVVVPHFGAYDLGIAYVPVAVFVFVIATSGAVVTDGMDGLMAGVSLIAFVAYGTIALAQGQDGLGAFSLAVAGATAGYLWFNVPPAQVIMGEIGAHALVVGWIVVAFMSGWWLLMPIIGLVFVAEGMSDVIQIAYFKRSHGKRIFRMAPIHYHFKLGGWSETQVVLRFWIAGLAGALAGVALALTD